MTFEDLSAGLPSEGTDPVTAPAIASEHFATHVNLLADQLGKVELNADGVELVNAAVHRAFTAAGLAAGLTIGLQRHTRDTECPHYNVITDAEWAPLTDGGGHMRKPAYECELQPGHPGPHMAHVQIIPEPDRFIWKRQDGAELVPLTGESVSACTPVLF
ncbi:MULTISPECIES: hypothetical protein [Streptosporangium]|uniref:Uncharacterized protein n=1 Tax=Streptosporangium brasiliense TaxID=47480 RepID=A0ABT9RJY0_9ACTN|nr:hypothetical protein [Streptosporangium brasiliense]MDP9869393.1 hypothetical protein [Streptosporangium brasiliense]